MDNHGNDLNLAPISQPYRDDRIDATGLWAAATVLFAFLAAGVIVYRSGNSDTYQVAASDVAPTAAQANPGAPPAILPAR